MMIKVVLPVKKLTNQLNFLTDFLFRLGKDQSLIDLSDRNNLGGSGEPPQMGFIGYPSLPPLPTVPNNKPFNYPPPYGGGSGGGSAAAPLPYAGPSAATGGAAAGGPPPFSYNIPPNVTASGGPNNEVKDLNTEFINVSFVHHVSYTRKQLQNRSGQGKTFA